VPLFISGQVALGVKTRYEYPVFLAAHYYQLPSLHVLNVSRGEAVQQLFVLPVRYHYYLASMCVLFAVLQVHQ